MLLFAFLGQILFAKIGMALALLLFLFIHLVYYFFSAEILMRIHCVFNGSTQKSKILQEHLDHLSRAYKIPAPKVFILNEQAPNFLILKKSEFESFLLVTEGLVHLLTTSELKSVLLWSVLRTKEFKLRFITYLCSYLSSICFLKNVFFPHPFPPERGIGLRSSLALGVINWIFPLKDILSSDLRMLEAEKGGLSPTIHQQNLKNEGIVLHFSKALQKTESYAKGLNPVFGIPTCASLCFINPWIGRSLFEWVGNRPTVDERLKKLSPKKLSNEALSSHLN